MKLAKCKHFNTQKSAFSIHTSTIDLQHHNERDHIVWVIPFLFFISSHVQKQTSYRDALHQRRANDLDFDVTLPTRSSLLILFLLLTSCDRITINSPPCRHAILARIVCSLWQRTASNIGRSFTLQPGDLSVLWRFFSV